MPQMEWDNIPVRRSERLQQEIPPTISTTTSSSQNSEAIENQQVPVEIGDLPDVGHGIEVFPLQDMDIPFEGDFLHSQEANHEQLADCEELYSDDEGDYDMPGGGGLEEMLWPPEMLREARNYGSQATRKRRARDSEPNGDLWEEQQAIRAVERLGGAGTSTEGGAAGNLI